MCQKATTNRVIVWFNCTQWIVTEVGSEVTVLPQKWTWPDRALRLQWFHNCHRLIVLPIKLNNNNRSIQKCYKRMLHPCMLDQG